MRYGVRMSVVISAVVLLVSGCATRDWVRGYVTPKEAALDQRIVTVEGQVGAETQRIDRRRASAGAPIAGGHPSE